MSPTPSAAPTQTLVLLFHPDINRSRANRALACAAVAIDGISIVDMQVLYPDGRINAEVEVARLLAAERIVLQFPLQWYATPQLLKAWQDSVLTRMFYINYQTEGRLLEGTPLLVATTAGNSESAYRANGTNLVPLEDLLVPLRVTANRCGMPWATPFLLYGANTLSPPALADAGQRYTAHLADWIAGTAGDTVRQDASSRRRA